MVGAKFLGGFGIGVVLGFSGAWILAHFYYKKKVEMEVNKTLFELDSKRESKDGGSEVGSVGGGSGAGSSDAESNNEVVGNSTSDSASDSAASERGDDSDILNRERIKYESYASYYRSDVVDDACYPDPAEMESPTEYEDLVADGNLITDENRDYIEGEEMTAEMNSGKKPKLITCESWDNEYPQNDKIQLEYYTGENGTDGCLVDVEADEEIFDEDRVVGDCLDKYGFRTNDEDVIYVRNFAFGADYEITKVRHAFVRL